MKKILIRLALYVIQKFTIEPLKVDLCSKFYFNSKIYLVRHIEFSENLLRFEAEEERSFKSRNIIKGITF